MTAMTIVDILIIYLAFGSPLAVYRYLETRGAGTFQRIAQAALALLFWIPSVVRIGYRHLSNADFIEGFVSRNNLDSFGKRLAGICDELTVELMGLGRDVPLYDVREVLERYVGLSVVQDSGIERGNDESNDLFDAAAHSNRALAAACLMRRNRRRLQRHHTRARQDYLSLFENLPSSGVGTSPRLLRIGIDLAGRLDDHEAIEALITLANSRGEVWKSGMQKLALSNTSAEVSPLSMQTVRLNND